MTVMIGKKLDWVRVCNVTADPQALIDKKGLPGPLKFAPHEIKDIPAKVWGRKFTLAWARRAQPADEDKWTAIQAGAAAEVQEADSMPELEETKLDALRNQAEKLGLKLKGSKAAIILQLRTGLIQQMVSDHQVFVLETIAQGAYEYDRAAKVKAASDGDTLPVPWNELTDKKRAETIAAVCDIIADPKAERTDDFGSAVQTLNEASTPVLTEPANDIQPIVAEKGADN